MALLSVAAFDIYRFSIPFIRPMKVGNILLDNREGFLISVRDHKGRTGYGEIAPLPGLDQTSLDACRSDLSILRKALVNGTFDTDLFDLTSPGLGMISPPDSLTPSTLFGLESALLSLYLQDNPASLPDVIAIPVNGLFIPDAGDDQIDGQIQTIKQSGMKTVKVKIGRLPADQEIRQILKLCDAFGKDLRLRLDGNRSLSSLDYACYFSALKHLNVEYTEEPLREGEVFPSDNSWPMAMDESLPKYLDASHPDPSVLPSGIGTVILKPGLLPGLSGMASFTASARKRNLQTVLSSSFNTGLTIATLSFFSFLSGLSPNTACGFDTLRYLQTDVIYDLPRISEGVFMLPRKLFANFRLNFSVLCKEDV